ncbi:MAG: UPF0182 family protein [Caldisericia bacterium]
MGVILFLIILLIFLIILFFTKKLSFKLFIIPLIFIPIIIFIILYSFSSIFVDYYFFSSLGYQNVYLIRFFYKFGIYISIFIITSIILFLITKFEYVTTPFETPERKKEKKIFKLVYKIIIFIASLSFTFIQNLDYNNILLFLNKFNTNIKTEILGKDLSFYLFSFPFLNDFSNLLLSITGFILFFSIIFFLIIIRMKYALSIKVRDEDIRKKIIRTFSVFILIVAFKTHLAIYNLIFTKRGAVFGIGYTDLHIRIPVYYVIIVLLVVLSIYLMFFTGKIYFKIKKVFYIPISVLLILIFLFYSVVPNLYQRFSVNPNELEKEKNYLSYNIKYTNLAYALDKFKFVQIPEVKNINENTINENIELIKSARIWDTRALNDTYKEIQGIRPYYRFYDVDIDRYIIENELREVMISARELDQNLLTSDSKSWVNLHLKFTHGYGVCMNPVNEVSNEGLPYLFIKDIPPKYEKFDIKIEKPEIYFGELTDNYIFVNTLTEEFDYPKGDENVFTTYKEESGVKIDSFIKRFFFAVKFNDINIFLSKYLNKDSRILYYRKIVERADKIAPFLLYGYDPYIVIDSKGNLIWILDAFTISNYFPYSERINYGDIPLNYIRNSVKCTINAYTGETKFYIIDENDPVINVYKKIYPTLFLSFDKMPEDLKSHLRYPDDLVEIQSYLLRDYHMKDVEVFYNKEDRWDKAKEKYISQTQDMIPYFIFMNINKRIEFVNILPMTPTGKSNLIALFVGRCDKENYGDVIIYQFSKETLIYGPLQFEARVDQDAEISKTLSLWNQQGSQVIRGNTIFLLLDSSILYTEPIYLQATQGKIPQLRKVVCASLENVKWGDDVQSAIKELIKGEIVIKEKNLNELLSLLSESITNYKKYSGEGNYSQAGKELERIEEIINEIKKLSP